MSDPKAKIVNLTALRGRAGTLPWEFVIDLGRNTHRIVLYEGAGPFDLLAMADVCEQVARELAAAAKTLRASAGGHAAEAKTRGHRR
jgi:hypothetical protein